MVKKLVAMALVSTMALSGLAACGDTKEEKPAADTGKEEGKDNGESGEKQTLKLAAFKGGNGEKSGKISQQLSKKKKVLK